MVMETRSSLGSTNSMGLRLRTLSSRPTSIKWSKESTCGLPRKLVFWNTRQGVSGEVLEKTGRVYLVELGRNSIFFRVQIRENRVFWEILIFTQHHRGLFNFSLNSGRVLVWHQPHAVSWRAEGYLRRYFTSTKIKTITRASAAVVLYWLYCFGDLKVPRVNGWLLSGRF